MLPFEEWKALVLTWAKQGQWTKIKISAQKRMEASGLVDCGYGSYWRWMHKNWLHRALSEDVLAKNKYGKYIPVVYTIQTNEVVGMRGKNQITEEKTRIDQSKFDNFVQEYEKFLRVEQAKDADFKNMLSYAEMRGNL